MTPADGTGSGGNDEDSNNRIPAKDGDASAGVGQTGEPELLSPDSDGRTVYAQQVTAVNGFAYGVQHADIHVFGNGQPLYLLANWPAEPASDPAWLGQLPSRMLNARRAVVPFIGRDADLTKLRQWRDTGPRLGVRWLYGPGGQGKTRLAAQLAAESLAAGWKVIAASHGSDADWPQPGSQDMTLAGTTGLLLILDYADRWLLSNLTWLFKNALLHQVGVRTRILMIGRSLDAWPAVKGILDTHQADTSGHRLPDLPPDHGRTAMFTVARDKFAAIYQQVPGTRPVDPAHLYTPSQLDDPDSEFGLTLAVHMVALVAVDAAAYGERPPEGIDALTQYLLNRERLHWARLYHDGTTDTGSGYQTPPADMNQAVFTAALTGAMDRPTGVALLQRLTTGTDPEQLATDHTVCYPPTADHSDPIAATVLEPLYPDRLTEDFLALTIPGHTLDYPTPDWAPTTATALLIQGPDEQNYTGYLARAVTFLAAAADRWPHLGDNYLYPLLHQHPDLAIRAGGTALMTLAAIRDIDIGLLETLEPLLPDGPHVDLDIAAAAISTALTPHRLADTTDPAQQALLHHNHACRLDNAGRREQILGPAEEAARIYRRLAEANPDAHLPALAMSLNSLSLFLAKLGRWEQALGVSEEAVDIYRRLAEANPNVYLPDLAMSVNNLGMRLAELGRWEQALGVSEEAVRLRRPLAEANPNVYLPDLAMSVNNLGMRLAELGRWEQALGVSEEAVRLRRPLAEANPNVYLPDLAMSVNNLGMRLAELGRWEQALGVSEEAVRLRRPLAEANPNVYLPDLAMSVNNLGVCLSNLGRREQALGPAEETVGIYRRLAAANPDVYVPNLAGAVNNLGVRLAELGRWEQALGVSEEAVRLRRPLAEANPNVYLPDLAMSVNNLGVRLAEQGRWEQALGMSEEAVGIYRRLAAANPDIHLPNLAMSVNNLGMRLSNLGRWEQALSLTEEAVGIYRRLAAANPNAHLSNLAGTVNQLGLRLADLGYREQALGPVEEAVGIYRRLAAANPNAHLPNLAMSVNNLGLFLTELGRQKRARRPAEEAVDIYRRLAAANPDIHLPNLAGALNNLGLCLAGLGRREQALSLTEETVGIYRRLAAANPDAYLPGHAASLTNLGLRLAEVRRRKPALTLGPVEEAVGIYRRLAAANPDAYLPSLAMALRMYASVCVNLRINLPRVRKSVTEAIDIYESLGRTAAAADLRWRFDRLVDDGWDER
ncbi:tetratricopeptide repeat protein [Actinoplanes flavus]|uniref:Tetratricopeptide repeat protein n=1 Tax=Actinoplanes flavus TaxID=2820290 RepID=A0ABS3UUC5_9ACTN|nr:tetratricopeptide repeat protein [Actinoplanes flavus]MBO3742201.1 tetratricopeptide repeat protein [Actinoplanes flavus]